MYTTAMMQLPLMVARERAIRLRTPAEIRDLCADMIDHVILGRPANPDDKGYLSLRECGLVTFNP